MDKVDKEYNKFVTNGWYYEKHSDKCWFELLKQGKIYAVKSKDVDSLLVIRKRNHHNAGLVIGFVDGNDDSINILINFAEQKARKNNDEHLSLISPAKTSFAKYILKKKYEHWGGELTDANIYLYELNF